MWSKVSEELSSALRDRYAYSGRTLAGIHELIIGKAESVNGEFALRAPLLLK